MQARRMWQLFEPLHAVTYFAPEAKSAFDAVGMRGFWMSYFAGRAAPLGPVGPEAVTALFFGFDPGRVRPALPSAWSIAEPQALLRARSDGALAAWQRFGVTVDEELSELMWQTAQAADCSGRALAAANQALPRPADPAGALWQATTTLREHRGDGHIACLVAQGVTPVQSHVLKAAAGEVDVPSLQRSRKLSAESWQTAAAQLEARGWLDGEALTPAGAAARDELERATDELAQQPWTSVGASVTARAEQLLAPVTELVLSSGWLSWPNPIGLTRS